VEARKYHKAAFQEKIIEPIYLQQPVTYDVRVKAFFPPGTFVFHGNKKQGFFAPHSTFQ
jgi:hypothetical protein